MLWLILFSPVIILVPLAFYMDRKKGTGDPKLNSENHRIEQDQAMHDKSFIFPGGEGPPDNH